jgi:hypothetical protein
MMPTFENEMLRQRATSSHFHFVGCSVLKKNPYTPSWRKILRHNPWPVTAQRIADLRIQSVKRCFGVFLACPHQEWMHVFLRTTFGPFGGVFCDKDNRPYVLVLAVFVRLYCWGPKRRVRISVFIAASWGRRANETVPQTITSQCPSGSRTVYTAALADHPLLRFQVISKATPTCRWG